MRRTLYGVAAAVSALAVTGLPAAPAVATAQATVGCSTSALINAIAKATAGDTLNLARHCTYHLTAAYAGADGLPVIRKRLTIHGHDATIVRDSVSAGAFRIFHVASGGDLRLDDVTVRGGDSPGDGGGILVENGGKLILEDVTLLDNTAAVRGGGVAVLQGATGVITRGWFKFNNADSGGGLQADGTVRADGTEFTRNHARQFGGAIDHDFGASVFKRTTATGNTAGLDGGAVDIDLGTIEFVDSRIRDNTSAGTRGGGIFNGATLKLTSTEVSGNVIGGVNGRGGGIYNASGPSTLVLKDSTVERNSANGSGTSQGGGIYNNGGTVTLDHSTVRGNASTVAPGGVFTLTQFTVVRSTIKENIPTNCAGSPVIVTGCVN